MSDPERKVGVVRPVVGILLLGATVTLSGLGLILTKDVYRELAYHHLSAAMKGRDYEEARILLGTLERSGIERFLTTEQESRTDVAPLIDIIAKLGSGQQREALGLIESLDSSFLEAQGALAGDAAALRSVLTEIDRYPAQETELREEQERALQKLNLLREDLEELLGLPPKPLSRAELYTEGVLEGLPLIENLPPVPDLVALRDLLPSIGGDVRVEGPEAAMIFQNRLEGDRKGSIQAAQAYDDATEQLEEAEARFQQNREKQEEHVSTLSARCLKEMIEMARPSPTLPLDETRRQIVSLLSSI